MELNQCNVVLTGASGGIGLSLAEQLCEAGAHVIAVGRQASALQGLQQRFADRVSIVQADLCEARGRQAVLHAARDLGKVNVLINAAGANEFGMLESQTDDALNKLLAVNVTATLQLTRDMLPVLRQQPRALVVNVGSTFGSIGYPGYTAYCATKFAIRGFSEALRRELADSHVGVLYVAPRATQTAMNSPEVVAMNAELRVAMDAPLNVARQIVRAIRTEREESYLGWPEKLFVRLNSVWPRMVDQALRKQLPVIQRFARKTP